MADGMAENVHINQESSARDTNSPISSITRECSAKYKHLCDSLNAISVEQAAKNNFERNAALLAIQDAHYRFKAWGNSIAAFQDIRLKSSLDSRLVEAGEVRNQIVKILKNLTETLDYGEFSHLIERKTIVLTVYTALPIITLEQPNENWGPLSDSEDDSGSNVDMMQNTTELDDLMEAMQDANSGLLKLSIAIRNSPRDDYLKAAARYRFDSRADINHVREKHSVQNIKNDYLIERLGKAISRRRAFLLYRKDHHDKLSRDWENVPAVQDVKKPEEGTIAMTKHTKATTFIQSTPKIQNEGSEAGSDHRGSFGSATSYEQTLAGEEATKRLAVPPPPKFAFEGIPFEFGQPFQCPLCYTEQTVKNKDAWKKHVFRDLKPYVCTFDCNLKMFSSRHEWFSHELLVHRREWACRFCTKVFSTKPVFSSHLIGDHNVTQGSTELEALILQSEEPVDRFPASACWICDGWRRMVEHPREDTRRLVVNEGEEIEPSGKLSLFRRHLGRHMEQLALFALPKGEDDEMEDDSASSDESDDEEIVDLEGKCSTSGCTAGRVDEGLFCSIHSCQLSDCNEEARSNKSYCHMHQCLHPDCHSHKESTALLCTQHEHQYTENYGKDWQENVVEGEQKYTKGSIEAIIKQPEFDERMRKIKLQGLSKASSDSRQVFVTDVFGREAAFDFDKCGNWQEVKKLISGKFSYNSENLRTHVVLGHYDLLRILDGELFHPQLGDDSIEPGAKLKMRMWASLGLDLEEEGAVDSRAEEEAGTRASMNEANETATSNGRAVAKDNEAVAEKSSLTAEEPAPEGLLAKKQPIRFKDAVGRKFSFPFHLVETWAGMENLIQQAFLHVDTLRDHVWEGHYDLLGPNGLVMIKQEWEASIEPDMQITMHLWPLPEASRATSQSHSRKPQQYFYIWSCHVCQIPSSLSIDQDRKCPKRSCQHDRCGNCPVDRRTSPVGQSMKGRPLKEDRVESDRTYSVNNSSQGRETEGMVGIPPDLSDYGPAIVENPEQIQSDPGQTLEEIELLLRIHPQFSGSSGDRIRTLNRVRLAQMTSTERRQLILQAQPQNLQDTNTASQTSQKLPQQKIPVIPTIVGQGPAGVPLNRPNTNISDGLDDGEDIQNDEDDKLAHRGAIGVDRGGGGGGGGGGGSHFEFGSGGDGGGSFSSSNREAMFEEFLRRQQQDTPQASSNFGVDDFDDIFSSGGSRGHMPRKEIENNDAPSAQKNEAVIPPLPPPRQLPTVGSRFYDSTDQEDILTPSLPARPLQQLPRPVDRQEVNTPSRQPKSPQEWGWGGPGHSEYPSADFDDEYSPFNPRRRQRLADAGSSNKTQKSSRSKALDEMGVGESKEKLTATVEEDVEVEEPEEGRKINVQEQTPILLKSDDVKTTATAAREEFVLLSRRLSEEPPKTSHRLRGKRPRFENAQDLIMHRCCQCGKEASTPVLGNVCANCGHMLCQNNCEEWIQETLKERASEAKAEEEPEAKAAAEKAKTEDDELERMIAEMEAAELELEMKEKAILAKRAADKPAADKASRKGDIPLQTSRPPQTDLPSSDVDNAVWHKCCQCGQEGSSFTTQYACLNCGHVLCQSKCEGWTLEDEIPHTASATEHGSGKGSLGERTEREKVPHRIPSGDNIREILAASRFANKGKEKEEATSNEPIQGGRHHANIEERDNPPKPKASRTLRRDVRRYTDDDNYLTICCKCSYKSALPHRDDLCMNCWHHLCDDCEEWFPKFLKPQQRLQEPTRVPVIINNKIYNTESSDEGGEEEEEEEEQKRGRER